VVLICSSCGQQQSSFESASDSDNIVKPEYPIHLQLSGDAEYKNTMTLADLASDVRYIPLETNDSCLMGPKYSHPQFTQDYIFIESMGWLLQFDQQGKFIQKINKPGKGPGECFVRDFGIDEKNQLIHIFDNWKLDVYTFTFEGKHVRTFRNPLQGAPGGGSPLHMGCDAETGNLFFTFSNGNGDMKYKYVVCDNTGNIVYKCPNYTLSPPIPTMTESVPMYNIYLYDSLYYYEDTDNDTVFVIGKDYRCSPAYIRDLPNRITLKDRLDVAALLKDPADFSDKNSYSGIREDDKYVYAHHYHGVFSQEYISFISLYDKQTRSLIENINDKIENNWDGGMDIRLYPSCQDGSLFALLLQPYDMKETLTPEHFASRNIAHPEKAEALKKLVSTLKDEDNPVLMLITTK